MKRRNLVNSALACSVALAALSPHAADAARQTNTATLSKLIVLPVCPTSEGPSGREAVGGLLASIFIPKLFEIGSNAISATIKAAATKAKNNATRATEARQAFEFYTYNAEDHGGALGLNHSVGCLVFVHGEFGPAGKSGFDTGAIEAVLPRGRNERPLIRQSDFGSTEISTENQIPPLVPHESLGCGRADKPDGCDGAQDPTFEGYFRALGLARAPDLYFEAKIAPAFQSLGEAKAQRDKFQLYPQVLWFNKGIGSRGGDKKPTLKIGFEFTRAADATPFASDPKLVNNAPTPYSVEFRDLPLGVVLGPDQLSGVATIPFSNPPVEPKGSNALSDHERDYHEFLTVIEKQKTDAAPPSLSTDQQNTLRNNRKYFYISPETYSKDPMLYIGKYVPVANELYCESEQTLAVIFREKVGCTMEDGEKLAKAQAVEVIMTERQSSKTCVDEAGEDAKKKEDCRIAAELRKHQWEVKRREAMEVLSLFETEYTAKANQVPNTGDDKPAPSWREFGTVIAQIQVTETRELGAFWTSVLSDLESDKLKPTNPELEAIRKAIYQTPAERKTAASTARTEEGKDLAAEYQYDLKMMAARNALVDYEDALLAFNGAKTTYDAARAAGVQEPITAAETLMISKRTVLRAKEQTLLEARGAANLAAFNAGKALPFPEVGLSQAPS